MGDSSKIYKFLKIAYIYFFGAATPRIRVLYDMAKKCKIRKLNLLSRYFLIKIERDYNCYLSINATIDPTVKFLHPSGIVVGKNAVIEKNVLIYQQVTLGGSRRGDWEDGNFPTIQEGSILYSGCKILGNINIGRNTIVGANAVVTKTCDADSVLIGVPAKNRKI